ncbi:MAG: DUF3105 domain-containing protein, partial [Nakamurella sp.]
MRHDPGSAVPRGFQAARRLALAWAVIALTTSCTAAIDGSATTAGGGPSNTSSGVTDPGDVQYSSTVGPTTGDGTVAPDGAAGAPGSHGRWLPSETNPDPTVDIEGVYIGAPSLYAQRYHFAAPDRVAYDRYPPVGGPHDPTWAACDGVVYDQPVRDEMMVHALEHGAVWIAYNPDTLSSADLVDLTALVPQVGYLVMSPYPELDTPLSLQAWGHQLPLESGADPRFQQFLLAMLRNPFLTPEPNATCTNP